MLTSERINPKRLFGLGQTFPHSVCNYYLVAGRLRDAERQFLFVARSSTTSILKPLPAAASSCRSDSLGRAAFTPFLSTDELFDLSDELRGDVGLVTYPSKPAQHLSLSPTIANAVTAIRDLARSRVALEPARNFKSVNDGHLNVADYEAEGLALRDLHPRLTVAGADGGIAEGLH
jgi:hypothetical protein